MNKLIVESKNDKIFIEAFIRHLHIHAEVDTPICSIDEFSPTERLNLVTNSLNKALKNKGIAPLEKSFEKINQFISVPIDGTITVEIACFFTNLEGKGELETVLKAIKTQDSTYADCLEAWRDCLEKGGKSISRKDFDKFWLSNYIRFDTCSKKDMTQSERKCSLQNFDYVMENKNVIFNFDSEILADLKSFLELFSN